MREHVDDYAAIMLIRGSRGSLLGVVEIIGFVSSCNGHDLFLWEDVDVRLISSVHVGLRSCEGSEHWS